MRYLVSFLCVLGLLASPLSVSAQVGKVATTSKPANGVWLVHAQNRLPPLLMLRASYYYLDVDPPGAQPAAPSEETKQRPVQSTQPTRSRLERWHPEAFVDPSTPTPEPALQLGVDSTGLEVTPTAPPAVEELERQRRRRAIAIGVSVTLGVVLVGVAIGAGVAMSNWEP